MLIGLEIAFRSTCAYHKPEFWNKMRSRSRENRDYYRSYVTLAQPWLNLGFEVGWEVLSAQLASYHSPKP